MPSSATSSRAKTTEVFVEDAPHTRRLRWGTWIFAGLLVLVAWASVAALLKFEWDDTLNEERVQNTNLGRVLQEQTARVLAAVEQASLRVRDAVATGTAAPDMVRFANETGLAPKILVQLSLVGADGRFVRSNLDPDGHRTGPVDLAEREHIRAHLAPGVMPVPGNGLFIGKPVLGKVSGRWTIQLSRVIRDAQGAILGVVVASLDPGYFEDLYRQVELGQQGGVALIGSDSAIRARVIGGQPIGMGSLFGHGGSLAQHSQGTPHGSYVSASPVDGVERIYAFRQVADYPLWVLVYSGLEEATTAWRSTRNATIGLAAMLSLAVLGAAAIFVGSLRRLEASHQALRRSEAQAQSANKAKSEFLAAVSHDLRTPLTAIRGFSELMEHRLEQPVFREQAGLIRKAAEHLGTLLNEILDLARVEAGAMPLNLEPVPLRPLLRGSADFFAMPASAKGLSLKLTVAPEVPDVLLCDGLRLKQVLNNLLSNAVKFTHQGEIVLQADTQPGWVRFHVQDTGPGLAPEKHELVFERFRQGDERVAYEHGGTGLGLALSRSLAERMGGTLTLESAPGQGARFTLSLPWTDADKL